MVFLTDISRLYRRTIVESSDGVISQDLCNVTLCRRATTAQTVRSNERRRSEWRYSPIVDRKLKLLRKKGLNRWFSIYSILPAGDSSRAKAESKSCFPRGHYTTQPSGEVLRKPTRPHLRSNHGRTAGILPEIRDRQVIEQ